MSARNRLYRERLRAGLLLRRFGLKVVQISEVRNRCRYWGQSGHALLHCICPPMTQSGHGTIVQLDLSA
jgi:hypothetical protein